VRAAALRAVAPDPFADTVAGNVGADRVDRSGAVAVGDDTVVRHPYIEGVAPFLDVTGVDAGSLDADADLVGARPRVVEFADLEHVLGGALSLAPCGLHRIAHGVLDA
jgi:hypothetical protein